MFLAVHSHVINEVCISPDFTDGSVLPVGPYDLNVLHVVVHVLTFAVICCVFSYHDNCKKKSCQAKRRLSKQCALIVGVTGCHGVCIKPVVKCLLVVQNRGHVIL